MKTIEFKKTYKAYYSPKQGKPEIVTPLKMQFIVADGSGDPNGSKKFQDAVGALYSVAYNLKFSRKKAMQLPDFTIGALECLWWSRSGKQFTTGQKQDWLWTVMIWVPDFITGLDVQKQVEQLKVKKPNPALADIRLETFDEGPAVQILHIGPYDEELPDIELMQSHAREYGFVRDGKHHEIYLSDPRRTAPEKIKTIIRHPVKRAIS